ncbi:RsmB/NOP family class I SAM-dependent RNA methyltransferase [Tropicimonas sp. IMCC34043]|uniref:RsmB/NOP family class I SAM-dependent RNA methyltransferase n=1 Tax=Tropicimonas sp. IMCC34043 TaxID=2248760 RepID=UPI000E22C479|nr:RsmB/NOP family class I SAM-dependent RNA methyltransferase [Tropicimonas sp. IMCC34043]
MTPEARVAAAAGILDSYLAGEPAEKVLTTWARHSRFAGSSDRAALRDLVYDAIRQRRSAAALGGAETGRGLMIGLLRARGAAPEALLTGIGHALAPLTAAEADHVAQMTEAEALDCPDWIVPDLRGSLGEDFDAVMALFQSRAEVFLRVNTARGDREAAQAALARDGVEAEPHALADTALRVTAGARRVQGSAAWRDGLVELQDAASQAVCAAIPLPGPGAAILDYCAGGGGKALALAARSGQPIRAHDIDPGRMRDLPERARRAGADIRVLAPHEAAQQGPYALVVADVPCSGSGAWRRQAEARWRLTRERLDELAGLQHQVLAQAAALTAPGGALAYATCSVLRQENEDQADRFLSEHPGWQEESRLRLSPLAGGDGFFLAVFRRKSVG